MIYLAKGLLQLAWCTVFHFSCYLYDDKVSMTQSPNGQIMRIKTQAKAITGAMTKNLHVTLLRHESAARTFGVYRSVCIQRPCSLWIPTVLRVWPDPDDKTVAHTGTKKQKQNIIIKTLYQPKPSKSLYCICLWAKPLTAYFLCVCTTGAGPHAPDGYHWTRGTCAEQARRGTSIFVLVFSYIALVFILIPGRTFSKIRF